MKNLFKVFVAMRSIAIIALVAVIGFSFTACGGDDGGGGGGGGSGGGGGGNSALIGKWYETQEYADDDLGVLLEFKSDGRLLVAGYGNNTYTATANTITVNNATSLISYYTISGTELTITGDGYLTPRTYYKPRK